jgi:hypothetical protein
VRANLDAFLSAYDSRESGPTVSLSFGSASDSPVRIKRMERAEVLPFFTSSFVLATAEKFEASCSAAN